MEMHAEGVGVNVATVSRPVNLPEVGVLNKPLAGDLGQVAVTPGELNAADAEFALFAMLQGCQCVRVNDGVVDSGERATDGDGLVGSQQLAAGVGADFRRAVGVDDLSPGARPGLDQRRGEGLARRHDIAADGVG